MTCNTVRYTYFFLPSFLNMFELCTECQSDWCLQDLVKRSSPVSATYASSYAGYWVFCSTWVLWWNLAYQSSQLSEAFVLMCNNDDFCRSRSPESLVDHGHMLFPCMKKSQGYMGSSSYLTFPGWWPLSSARCPPVEAHLSCNKHVQRSLRHWAGTPLTARCLWKKLRTSYEISVTLLLRPLQVTT